MDHAKYETPREFYEILNDEFRFNCDPCPINWIAGDPDGLEIEWGTSTFCNPPYANTAAWIRKAHAEWKKGKTVVMLINAITDTKVFHEYILGQAELRFVKGRICFVNRVLNAKKSPNSRPSMIVLFKSG